MKKIITLFFLIIFLSYPAFTQKNKEITIGDIWEKGLFFGESFEGISFAKNDSFFTYLDINQEQRTLNLIKQSIQGNQKTILIPSSALISEKNAIVPLSYEFSNDESKILLETNKEAIYRRSFTADYFIFDQKNKSLIPVSTSGKQSYVTFSPDGNSVAFVRDNNIFIKELTSEKETQVTFDGEKNKIINGSTDWVYEEEFEFTKGFFWSSDSKKIAFYKFDESEVKEYNMQVWKDLYPKDYKYKYPKAGEKNSSVSIHCYNVASKQTSNINIGDEKDFYIPRIKWTNDPEILSILKLNRKQNNLDIFHVNIQTEKATRVYNESNNTYVEINDHLTYLKDGKSFIISSEKDGFRHLYQYNFDGKLINQITKGNWEISNFLGINEQNNLLYFTSTEVSPLKRFLYSINLNGSKKIQLSKEEGTHEITASPSFNYFIDEYSKKDTPPTIRLIDSKGNLISELISNDPLKKTLKNLNLPETDFFSFKSDKVIINGSMIKPASYDPKLKYPVLIYVYGGPGSQNVLDHWIGPDYGWFQSLAQKGFIIVTIDNRGTGGRGAEFKKITQHQLGKYETEDLINATKYLNTLSFVDKNRIGIFGWSFGGYLSSLAMTVGADFFKAGIAVAPVTSWRFYDTIYTERFLGDPKENASGYDDNSPLNHAEKLKGSYLLIHGTADDNVHVQNSLEMEKALINANKHFQVFYYPDRNHSIYGGNTRVHLYTMMTDFLIKNL